MKTSTIMQYINSLPDKRIVRAFSEIFDRLWTKAQSAPATMTTAATITITQMLTKIINATPTATGATVAYTLPTGTLCDSGLKFDVNESFDWVLINNALAAADTITLTAGTDHTIVGNPIVQSLHSTTGGVMGYSAMFRTRKTAQNTYVTYRIA
ncbi:MAG: hypothetical protein WC710_14935 [Gallionella sp.]|jgi:hypothetical protein